MKDREDVARQRLRRLLPSFGIVGFGLGCLAFLVAIDRPHWFELRPATGTATALSHAAQRP